ncbi:MAG: SDR family NAD(P)-dependent oxidoreductase [Bauldia sp.]|nr:SDR family NAD(P)-dependent oxidoreductase [Bauldia sp.]
MSSQSPLRGKRVLVTGAAGFIGSHLVEALVESGASVTALIRYNSTGSRGWLGGSPVEREVAFVQGDIGDFHCVRAAMKGQEIVFHLAALIGIPYSYVAPHQYVRVNVEGTVNVVQAAREESVARVVQTSTSEVYGTALRTPIDEDHPKQPQSPYSASKIASDNLAESYFRSFGTPVVIVRPFNTFGPRQSTRAVIPTIITQCLAGGPIRLGSVTPTRDMNYVGDTVDGFLRAAAADGVVGEEINLGSGEERSIGEIAEMIAGIIGVPARIEAEDTRMRPAQSEVFRLIADASKAQRLLGWRPALGFEEGLRRTVDWFRDNARLYRVGEYAV